MQNFNIPLPCTQQTIEKLKDESSACVSTWFNSLWPSDAIWRQRSGSTLAQVMAITWTNVDWSSVKSSDIHIRAISQEMPQPSIIKICLKIICLKFTSNFPGANEFRKVRSLPASLITYFFFYTGTYDIAMWHMSHMQLVIWYPDIFRLTWHGILMLPYDVTYYTTFSLGAHFIFNLWYKVCLYWVSLVKDYIPYDILHCWALASIDKQKSSDMQHWYEIAYIKNQLWYIIIAMFAWH